MNEIIAYPEDFMFQLTIKEWRELITICDNLGAYKYSPSSPWAFTEQGVAMLSGILRSPLAIKVNIAIMRAFVRMRELLENNKELKDKIEQLDNKYDGQFKVVFEALKLLMEKENEPRNPVGFKIPGRDRNNL
ncbi:MAG TPA: ORF6N domain-containing protein [Bacteroidales bacterium]|nr:ORF6N domain-containing protein [Bacteroidales bacterium]HPI85891.1 ORF6N domain-containing protein [Bacteroidales bacterium]HPM92071.1 ORF6N domain-containing protein [Bacteroidales bacterium]